MKAKPSAYSLDIVYEDSMCIVVNKPAGLAVQGGKGIGVCLDSILASSFEQRPLLVHRLDRDTSGLILVAKNAASANAFSKLLAGGAGARTVTKRYTAVCSRPPEKPEGIIRLELETHGKTRKSETRYRLVRELAGGFSLVELELGTGRMHQIRRHLAMTGSPVLGDDKYGDFALNRSLHKTHGLRRLLLHASRLIIPQMPGGSKLDIQAPLPEHFRDFVDSGT